MEEKKINDQVNKIVGGKSLGEYFEVEFDSLKFHFGQEFDKYQAENYIGKKVILKDSNLFGSHYYIGILINSEEKPTFFGTTIRENTLVCVNDKSKELTFEGADCMWTYVN